MFRRIVCLALVPLVVLAPAAQACRQNIKFKNETGVNCNDLHIVFNRGVSITNTGAFGNNAGENGQNAHDLNGGTVNNGSDTKIDVTSVPCDNIQIKKWWWTNSTVQQGVVHEGEPSARVSFDGGNAAGGGVIRVRIDGADHLFNTIPGMPPAQSNQVFRNFLSSLVDGSNQPLIFLADNEPTGVIFQGNVVGNPALQLAVQLVAPDPAQTVQVLMGTTAVPAAGPAGLLALGLALAASAAWVLVRRRRSEAA